MIKQYNLIQTVFLLLITKVLKQMIVGSILGRLGNFDQALSCYDLAIKINPTEPTVYWNKGLNHIDYNSRESFALIRKIRRSSIVLQLSHKVRSKKWWCYWF